jgi:hypothetical protein
VGILEKELVREQQGSGANKTEYVSLTKISGEPKLKWM